ncbi:uncharacterized protein SPAPADRAFT_52681 [Spathaspora passalidarum NRRL Y-27907]|uniref:Uncharacterized protein n=1 Tax=Spathaspora passalidarum (strain NRRL Y-27907 / 11-Y1) TaxID=619300 RepID=G3AUQ7_SPAPN|nr:uncharacterized protein SPAPADRAFT_52681 [Spathaspora passalidarum NRRL Y-27907]EGW30613.1 hypothetical protein SPAPADRAFT_52681 [Spathaspora passalidarum NRRL Y-27907]
MKVLCSLISFFFATFVVTAAAIKGDAFQQEFNELLTVLESYNDTSVLKRDYAPLTSALTALNKSGQGVQIAHTMYSSKATQSTVINVVEDYIKATTLTQILKDSDDSDMSVDIVMILFTNSNMIPGLTKIIKTLHDNGVLSFSLKKRGLLDGILGKLNNIFTSIQNESIQTIVKLMNAVTDSEDIYESLEKSGLFISLFEDIVTTTDGQAFSVNLVTDIINKDVITWSSLMSAVNSSAIIANTTSKLFTNATNRQIIFHWISTNGLSVLLEILKALF